MYWVSSYGSSGAGIYAALVVRSGWSAARGTASYELRHCCILFLSYIKLHAIGETVSELNKTKYFNIVKILIYLTVWKEYKNNGNCY